MLPLFANRRGLLPKKNGYRFDGSAAYAYNAGHSDSLFGRVTRRVSLAGQSDHEQLRQASDVFGGFRREAAT